MKCCGHCGAERAGLPACPLNTVQHNFTVLQSASEIRVQISRFGIKTYILVQIQHNSNFGKYTELQSTFESHTQKHRSASSVILQTYFK